MKHVGHAEIQQDMLEHHWNIHEKSAENPIPCHLFSPESMKNDGKFTAKIHCYPLVIKKMACHFKSQLRYTQMMIFPVQKTLKFADVLWVFP